MHISKRGHWWILVSYVVHSFSFALLVLVYREITPLPKNPAHTKVHRPLQWRHNEHNCVSNHHPRHCLLNRLFGHRLKKTSKFRVTCLCVGNSPRTGEFPAQMASNAENVSIWWRHHASTKPQQNVANRETCCYFLEIAVNRRFHCIKFQVLICRIGAQMKLFNIS